jgi:membrane-associated phospholipid phosphatase
LTYTKIQGLFVIFILLIDTVWVSTSSNRFLCNVTDVVIFFASLGSFWTLYYFYKKTHPLPKIVVVWFSLLLFITFNAVATVLLYSAYTVEWPLVTGELAFIDQSLGFDFLSLYQWFQAHQGWNAIFTYIYKMHFLEIGFILIFFSYFREERYIQQFLMLYMISLLLTIVIGSLIPAGGALAWYSYPPESYQLKALHHLYELRQGIVNVKEIDGITTFPSFHTTLALLFIYTFRCEKKIIFVPILVLNILMIFSCIVQGAHFLIDLFGGLLVFIIALGIENFLFRYLDRDKIAPRLPIKLNAFSFESENK